MADRIMHFMPSVLILLAILVVLAGLFFLYFEILYRRWGQYQSPQEVNTIDWAKQNIKRLAPFKIMKECIGDPIIEELIFRAPLVVAFSSLSLSAWIGILITAAVFAVIHYSVPKTNINDVMRLYRAGIITTKDFATGYGEAEKIYNKRNTFSRKMHVVLVFPLGIIFGYSGIVSQSIFVPVTIHIAWNVTVIIVIPALVTLLFRIWK